MKTLSLAGDSGFCCMGSHAAYFFSGKIAFSKSLIIWWGPLLAYLLRDRKTDSDTKEVVP
jgi:hypothetical protein